MTDTLRPATLKDLQAILANAERHPAARQKIADAAEDVLRQAGLMATPDALDFLRSLGQTTFNEDTQTITPTENDPLKGGAAET